MDSKAKSGPIYIAFLRGINIGGHHKIDMKDLKEKMPGWGYNNIQTVLNSGNVIFRANQPDVSLENQLAQQLEETYGFPVPLMIRSANEFNELMLLNPFVGVDVHKDLRLYVTFLRQKPQPIVLPWISEDNSYKITGINEKSVFSILDVSVNPTPKAMLALEKLFGKDITTRNWNTLLRISAKL